MGIDGSFDIYVADLYRWLCMPPKVEDMDSVYSNEYLNELMAGYRDAQDRSKEFFEKRVKHDLESAAAGTSANGEELDADTQELEKAVVAPKESWADIADSELTVKDE
jgi:Family of unknown function (DUF5832)